MSQTHFAHTTDFAFVDALISFGDDYYELQPGDVIGNEDLKTTDGEDFPGETGIFVSRNDDALILREPDTGKEYRIEPESYYSILESPMISGVWQQHLDRKLPDGIAFADGIVDGALIDRLRADVKRLCELEPVDYHPGSGTKVRDLVHPSLYPYIAGRSTTKQPVAAREEPDYDRFGRDFEGSRYQWLPTPFAVDENGKVRIDSYINNLDRTRHAQTYDDLSALFETALPLFESVVGYVEHSEFFTDANDEDNEAELPEKFEQRHAAPPTSLRGRELLVIPKIVEYRLAAGETHEGVWHVEGMSHEHIIATCVYVLDRDPELEGGALSFKRAYTREEAGRLFWNIPQGRPRPVGDLVDEGLIPLGSVETPAGRMVIFPNSHVHKLNALRVQAGAAEAYRRVIVFWLVDPKVTIPSTRDVAPQQGVIPHDEALAIRLELMEERKRHKQSLNVRTVSLCEH